MMAMQRLLVADEKTNSEKCQTHLFLEKSSTEIYNYLVILFFEHSIYTISKTIKNFR